MSAEELIEVGQVQRPFGIRGELKVRPVGEPEPLWSGLREVYLQDREHTHGPFRLERVRLHQASVLIKLTGIDTPEAAGALRQARVAVPYAALPPLPEGEFYFCDLLGCRVELAGGQPLGTVTGYVPTADHDLLIVRDGARERLIPTQEAVLLSFDREQRCLVVAWDPEAAPDED